MKHQTTKTGWYFSEKKKKTANPTASFDCPAKELVDTTKEGVMDVRNSNETHTNNTSDNYTTKTGRVPQIRNIKKGWKELAVQNSYPNIP